MSEPVRIQRKRAKGWKMPPGVVYVGRPTKWGNPFVVHDWRAAFRAVSLGERGDKPGRLRAAIKLYKLWLTGKWCAIKNDDRTFWEKEVMTVNVTKPPTLEEIRRDLAGKTLACWCPLDKPCHADVLLELANPPPSRQTGER